MDFLKIVRSIEGLLYEVMSWIIFYPTTMWRVIRHPLTMMKYSESIGLFLFLAFIEHFSQFTLFLLLSILLAGISGWARLSLNAHTERQVYLGYVIGLGVVIATVSLATVG